MNRGSMTRRRGTTLIEVMIAITLVSALSVGILMAMRVGLDALDKTNGHMMRNRRVAGTQRILQQQLAAFIPAYAMCNGRFPFFQAEPQAMRFVSSYSLKEAWRGRPQILEFLVMPREQGGGVRLIVNEIPYTGSASAGATCLGPTPGPSFMLSFLPIQPGPQSFVLADKLEFCRFSYLRPLPPPAMQEWIPVWTFPGWPRGVRIEMAPLEPAAGLAPVTVTADLRSQPFPGERYEDR